MTKAKIQGGSPSKFYSIFSLTDLLKLPVKLKFDLCLAMPCGITKHNRIRTTILHYNIDIKMSQKVPGHQNVRKLPYLFSNI